MKFQTISTARKRKLLKSVNMLDEVVGDNGWTGEIGNHILLDFIIFRFLLTNNLDIMAKIMKT